MSATVTTLAALRAGQSATVRAVTGDSAIVQRILAMGLLEGSDVRVIRFAPAGDPMEVEVLGYPLSLRKSEAANVEVDHIR
ncbi:MAG: ferrous iron transport protein A [Planctomycetota bacterium]